MFKQNFTCSALLVKQLEYYISYFRAYYPLSLATTHGISIDFFFAGYLDVSVHQLFDRI